MLAQTITLLVFILSVNIWQSQEVESVRLCGQKLADFLNYICQNYGGFHSPGENQSDVNTSVDSEISLKYRRSMKGKDLATLSKRADGVVEECCRKACSRLTLLSYCAGHIPTNADFEEENISSPNFHNLNNLNEDNYIVENQEFEATTLPPSLLEYSHLQPLNLGQTVRNRPIFIVLPQAQEVSSEDLKI